jgi:protein-S-isoprenylcysteine O-methyltransferase Ste14
VRTRASAVAGSIAFFVAAPVTVAVWVPYLLTGWRCEAPFFGLAATRIVGVALAMIGLAALLDCFRRFALEGVGTPAPVAPPRELVVSGPYRYVRNPMYVAVVGIVVGQAILFGSRRLLAYAFGIWLPAHLFVMLYEEPTLAARFGASYQTYRANVRRWWPRLTPWAAPRRP